MMKKSYQKMILKWEKMKKKQWNFFIFGIDDLCDQ